MEKLLKYDHSPLDYTIFAVLNSSIFGLIFSLSMFHKSYEPSKFDFRKKLIFTGRNILVISTLHGLNQYLSKFLKIQKNRKKLKDMLNIKSNKTADFLSSLISSAVPSYLALKIYFYKNNYVFIERKFFFMYGMILMLFDYINYDKKN